MTAYISTGDNLIGKNVQSAVMTHTLRVSIFHYRVS